MLFHVLVTASELKLLKKTITKVTKKNYQKDRESIIEIFQKMIELKKKDIIQKLEIRTASLKPYPSVKVLYSWKTAKMIFLEVLQAVGS